MHAKKRCRKSASRLAPFAKLSHNTSRCRLFTCLCCSLMHSGGIVRSALVWCLLFPYGVYCFRMVSTALPAASSKHQMYVLLDGHDQAMLSLFFASCLCSLHVMKRHVSLHAVGRAKQKASGRGWGHARSGPPVACQQECPQVTSFPRGDCVTGLLLVSLPLANQPSLLWPQLKDALFWLMGVCAQQLHVHGFPDSNRADDHAPLIRAKVAMLLHCLLH